MLDCLKGTMTEWKCHGTHLGNHVRNFMCSSCITCLLELFHHPFIMAFLCRNRHSGSLKQQEKVSDTIHFTRSWSLWAGLFQVLTACKVGQCLIVDSAHAGSAENICILKLTSLQCTNIYSFFNIVGWSLWIELILRNTYFSHQLFGKQRATSPEGH